MPNESDWYGNNLHMTSMNNSNSALNHHHNHHHLINSSNINGINSNLNNNNGNPNMDINYVSLSAAQANANNSVGFCVSRNNQSPNELAVAQVTGGNSTFTELQTAVPIFTQLPSIDTLSSGNKRNLELFFFFNFDFKFNFF